MLRFLSKRGFSEVECFVFSEKGAFPKWNASFSQQKGLFRSGMLCFLRKRGFSEVECFVFSEKGAFPKWNASFSQKKGATAVKPHFLRKKKEALLAIFARGTHWGAFAPSCKRLPTL